MTRICQPADFRLPDRPVNRMFLHCTAASTDDTGDALFRLVQRWHVEERGWSDVGYHYLIDAHGGLVAGRPLWRRPAAQAGHNTGTIAICLHGLHKADFTEAQFATLRALCGVIHRTCGGDITVHGHREVAPKTCPVFDYRRVLARIIHRDWRV